MYICFLRKVIKCKLDSSLASIQHLFIQVKGDNSFLYTENLNETWQQTLLPAESELDECSNHLKSNIKNLFLLF